MKVHRMKPLFAALIAFAIGAGLLPPAAEAGALSGAARSSIARRAAIWAATSSGGPS